MKKLWLISDFNGGISDDEVKGIKGSCKFCQGVNVRSEPGILKVHQKLKKDTASTVVDLCNWMLPANNKIYAFGDAGNIYEKTGSTWSKVFTDGTARAILGAGTDGDYLYWATATKLHRFLLGGTWGGADEQVDWATLTSDTAFHPIMFLGDNGYVGCGKDMAAFMRNTAGTSIDASFNSSTLDLPTSERIKSLIPNGKIILLGTWQGSNIYEFTEANLYEWDPALASSSYDDVNDLRECGINAMLNVQRVVFIWAGIAGNMYYYNGSRFVKLKKIPGIDAAIGEYGYINPGSVTNYTGIPHFALNNAGKRMIYSYGTSNKNYPNVLIPEYIISTGNTGSTVTLGGLCAGRTNEFYVAWKDDTTYGIDQIDITRKNPNSASPYDKCYYETLVFDDREPCREKMFEVVYLKTKPLGAGTAIRVYYKIDDQSTWQSAGTMDTDDDVFKQMRIFKKGYRIQLSIRASAATASNLGPEITDIGTVFEVKPLVK